MMTDPNMPETRNSNYDIHPNILNRWSPRSFNGEEISDKDLFTLFEAARWAPSSFNSQPWRFIFAKKNTKDWNRLFDLLVDFNKQWCTNASVLVVIISGKNFEHNGKPSPTHQFDTGSAWENLAIQATFQGLATHAMAGFDHDKAKKDLAVPDDFEVVAMVAIGKRGPKERLSAELKQREVPSTRKPLDAIIMEGKFGNRPTMR